MSPMNSIPLPSGLSVTATKSFPDAWFGEVREAGGRLVFRYSAGQVPPVFTEATRGSYFWVRSNTTEAGLLEYGLKAEGETRILWAEVGGSRFSALANAEEEVEALAAILPMVAGQCSSCEKPVGQE